MNNKSHDDNNNHSYTNRTACYFIYWVLCSLPPWKARRLVGELLAAQMDDVVEDVNPGRAWFEL